MDIEVLMFGRLFVVPNGGLIETCKLVDGCPYASKWTRMDVATILTLCSAGF